jgi:thymidylate synthase (FAD)
MINEFCMQINITKKQRERASEFLELTGIKEVDDALILNLELTRQAVRNGVKNDFASLMLSQAWKYRFVVKFNYRSLQNFFNLRRDKHAHFQIREVADEMYKLIPDEHKFIFDGDSND